LVLNGVTYAAEKTPANGVNDIAAELATAATLGTKDKWGLVMQIFQNIKKSKEKQS